MITQLLILSRDPVAHARDAYTINLLSLYMEYNRISDIRRKFETSNLIH